MYYDKETQTAFLHIPKTGGTWVCKTTEKIIGRTLDAGPDGRHGWDIPQETKTIVASIRDPISWYASAYSHIMRVGVLNKTQSKSSYIGRTQYQIFNRNPIEDSFNDFIKNLLEEFPDGPLTRIYEDHDAFNADVHLRQYNLNTDYSKFVGQQVKNHPLNTRPLGQIIPQWDQALAIKVSQIEHKIYKLLENPRMKLWVYK